MQEQADNRALKGMIGKRVIVYSNTGDDDEQDQGVLEAYDYPWIRIRKGKAEILCFPLHNVRLVKLEGRYQEAEDTEANVLLRPALGGAKTEEERLLQSRAGSGEK